MSTAVILLLKAFWKPILAVIGSLAAMLRLNWLKGKVRAQKQEIRDLRTKERIYQKHEEIERDIDEYKKHVQAADNVDDLQLAWDRMRLKGKAGRVASKPGP